MMPQTILEIIKLSLEVTLELIRGIPVESRQAAWKDHERRMDFFLKLFERFDTAPTTPSPRPVKP